MSVVTISTLRIIFLSRGMKHLAPIVGFFEITIWLFAIGQVMKNLNNPGCFLGFGRWVRSPGRRAAVFGRHVFAGPCAVPQESPMDLPELIDGADKLLSYIRAGRQAELAEIKGLL